jgi:peptidoglycan/LPS O-acetylase OafA/YrhL
MAVQVCKSQNWTSTIVRRIGVVGKRNQWLDVCRALAILLVMISHGRYFLLPLAPWINQLKFGGFLGVELFFVLSGFLIGTIMISESIEHGHPFAWIPRFWARRWLRTIPNYVLFLLVNLAIIGTIRPAPQPNLFAFLTFTQNLAWPPPAFFTESWSLAVEEIFYLVVPLAMSVTLSVLRRKEKAVVVTAALIFFISIAVRSFVVLYGNPSFADLRVIVLLRMDAIMTGVLMAWAWLHATLNQRKRLRRIAVLGLPLFFVSAYFAALPDKWLDTSTAMRLTLFSLASFGCAALTAAGMNLKIPAMIDAVTSRLARWSYSAYLANLPVLMALRYLIPPPSTMLESVLLWLAYMSSTMLVSFIVYRSFERPILLLRDRVTR